MDPFYKFFYDKEAKTKECLCVKITNKGLEPPSLTAAVFKTADLPISLFLQRAGKE